MKSALLVVDIQNDFCPGGALPVPQGDLIIPAINSLIAFFPEVIATKDWHPPGHISFASRCAKPVMEMIETPYGPQILWPDHCVQETWGAEFHPALATDAIKHVVYKGTHPEIDSYSTFFDNARRQQTGLHRYLQDAGITELYLCGLATDYCVLYSSLDALELGYSITVIENACRGVNVAPDDSAKAMQKIVDSGGRVIASTQIHGQGKEGMR
ncbi:MAG: isochorismatase [Desulfobulbaceae bacterium BRH_c16a]|nr:MAG: isochorismatase [Desulfobulbaceae bacterium BRH_c16a]